MAVSRSWSQRICDAFEIVLPTDVVDWLDGGLWRRAGGPLAFNVPVSPERLLDPSSATVWGGQMPPDTLPICGNGCGDVLSLRVATDGTVSEVIRWDHEGGLWRPYGRNLAEALLFDAALFEVQEPGLPKSKTALIKWATAWSPAATDDQRLADLERAPRDIQPLVRLLRHGLAEVPARQELCRLALRTGLMRYCEQHGGDPIAQRLGVQWPEFAQWLTDPTAIPPSLEGELCDATGVEPESLTRQEWDDAISHAAAVIGFRRDLAWTYAVLGRAAERAGDLAKAVRVYRAGVEAPGTTADFTYEWGAREKFVFRRLRALGEEVSSEAALDLRAHWLGTAQNAETQGAYDRAYRYYYLAGWDDFFTNDMDVVLDGLLRTADAAGFRGLYCVARHHRQCL